MPDLKEVLTIREMSQDMKEHDNEFVLSSRDSLMRYLLFMATNCSKAHGEVYARHQANHRGCYYQEIEAKGITSDRKSTHLAWIENIHLAR